MAEFFELCKTCEARLHAWIQGDSLKAGQFLCPSCNAAYEAWLNLPAHRWLRGVTFG